MKRTRLSLAVLLALTAPLATAGETHVFAEILRTQAVEMPDMLWNQRKGGFKTEMDMKSMGYRIGLERGFLRLSYFNLGRVSSDAEASGDEACVGQHLNGTAVAACNSSVQRYVTSHGVEGVALTAIYRWQHVFVEGGWTYVDRQFSIAISSDQRPFVPVERLSAHANGIGYLLGAGIHHKKLSLGVYVYQDNAGAKFGEFSNDGSWPAGIGTTYAGTIGYRF